MEEMQVKLNELWGGVVKKYKYDIIKQKILFDIVIIDNSERMEHQLTFEGISSVSFYENNGENRLIPKNFDENDYLELTSIQYVDGNVGSVSTSCSGEKWIEQYYAIPNFILEIWSSILLIEANKVTIDGVSYEVNLIKLGKDL